MCNNIIEISRNWTFSIGPSTCTFYLCPLYHSFHSRSCSVALICVIVLGCVWMFIQLDSVENQFHDPHTHTHSHTHTYTYKLISRVLGSQCTLHTCNDSGEQLITTIVWAKRCWNTSHNRHLLSVCMCECFSPLGFFCRARDASAYWIEYTKSHKLTMSLTQNGGLH